MIRTVMGDIPKEQLGVTMAHEHFIVDLDRVRKDGVSKIEYRHITCFNSTC